MTLLDALLTLFCVLVALVVIFWATWALVRSIRAGAPKAKSFKEWFKIVRDAIWGL